MRQAFWLKFRIDQRLALAMVAGAWLFLIALGFGVLNKYDTTPARLTRVQTKWPSCSLLPSSTCPTLVMVVHPQCPCTRASINELAVLMTHCQNRLKADVLVFTPIGAKENWERTDLFSSASIIPGVTVVIDRGGVLASKFAATTSGQTLLYDSDGRLIFDGGITSARGHFGGNISLDVLENAVLQGSKDLRLTKTYGCSLLNDPTMLSENSVPR